MPAMRAVGADANFIHASVSDGNIKTRDWFLAGLAGGLGFEIGKNGGGCCGCLLGLFLIAAVLLIVFVAIALLSNWVGLTVLALGIGIPLAYGIRKGMRDG